MHMFSFEQGAAAGVGMGERRALNRLANVWVVVVSFRDSQRLYISKSKRLTGVDINVHASDTDGWEQVGADIVSCDPALQRLWPACPKKDGARCIDGILQFLCRVRLVGSVHIRISEEEPNNENEITT